MSSSEVLPPARRTTADSARAGAALLLGLGLAALLALLFADRFRELSSGWVEDDNYSHGFLVPAVSAWLAWEVLRRHGLSGEGATLPGLFWVVTGALLHLWAVIVWWPPVDFLALATLLYGFAVLAGGRRWAQRFLFPILFLFFMFPLSPVLLDRVATGLQGLVTPVAAALLRAFVPAYAEGNTIHLPGARLEVGEQCSGLRQILAFSALTLLVAYLSRRRLPVRVGLVLAGLPIALTANLLRVLLMACLLLHFGPDAISERRILFLSISYHTAWGLLTMVVGLGLLLAVAWWLGRVFPNRTPDQSAEPKEAGAATRPPIRLSSGFPRRFGAAVLCLAAAAGVQLALEAHLAAAGDVVGPSAGLTEPLQAEGEQGFPLALGEWSGTDVTPDAATLPYFTGADDRLNRLYVRQDESGPACVLWMVHYRDGRDRRHHPLICYKVAGYTEEPGGHQAVPLAGEGSPAQRFCFTRGEDRGYPTYVYYWHYTFEPPDAPGLSAWQRLHAQWAVRPSLTVQVFTAARSPEELDRAAEFARLVDDRLKAHLPPGARRGSETLPITTRR